MIRTKFNEISNSKVYFIADIGANHDGSLSKAVDLIHLCKESGAHTAKFQNFSASKIVSKYEFESWQEMVDRSNELTKALGDGVKRIETNEQESYYVQRRAICANKTLKKGHSLTYDDIFPLRPFPDDGFHPFESELLIGKVLVKDLKEGETIKKFHLE